jgi:hypothetical protein
MFGESTGPVDNVPSDAPLGGNRKCTQLSFKIRYFSNNPCFYLFIYLFDFGLKAKDCLPDRKWNIVLASSNC